MADEPKKNVLMVAYDYPPVQAGGVCRTLKFSKYLPECGWSPHVLTVSNPPGPRGTDWAPPELDETVRIHRSRSLELENVVRFLCRRLKRRAETDSALADALRWRLGRLWNPLSAPDPLVYWAIPAIPRALRVIRREGIHALYSTSWPYSDHLAALVLHWLTGKPWIADFRDPFTRHYNYGASSHRKDRFNRWLEAAICRKARFVINPTQRATNQMRADHPDIEPSRFVTIRNGFDEAEFARPTDLSSHFEMLHAGSFYLSRRPDLILQATRCFLRRCPDAEHVTRMTFMGKVEDPCEDFPFLTVNQWSTRTESIHAICRSRILLLVRHPECSLTIPGKLYEYMASGNHILALIGRQPELVELLQSYGNASILSFPSVAQLADQLQILFRRYKAGRLERVPMSPFVAAFSRRTQTAELAQLLNIAVNRSEVLHPHATALMSTLPHAGCPARVA